MFQNVHRMPGTILANRNEVHDESRRTTISDNVCHSVQQLNIPSAFQNTKDQYTQNNFANFTYGCKK